MIESISINNYGLIDKTEIDLEEGFSVITGETGAGKSILLGAIGLTLGQRADSSAIMDKSKKCVVEIIYNVQEYNLQRWFEENDLDYSENVVVRREVTVEGKSRGFINDTPVNNKLLKEFGSYMIDIHSQHQSLLLGQPEYQIEILDSFCNNGELLSEYQELYNQFRKQTVELKNLKNKVADAEKEEDYLRFQFSQLENAQLKMGEKEDLERELEMLNHAESIKSSLNGITWNFRDNERSIISVLKEIRHSLDGIANALPEAKEYRERIESVVIELNDLADEAERKGEGIEYDGRKIEAIDQRLSVIYDLLYKYKVEDVADLLKLYSSLEQQLKNIEDSSGKITVLEKELQETELQMKTLTTKIHHIRQETQKLLCDKMKRLLIGLGIKHAEFVVELVELDHFTPTGCDDVRFLFSANKNQQPGEIAKVASGGEISRVMLALKYVLSGSKQLPVIIFDEIDTGLSGEVAHRMAQIMKEMAMRMQVISISHLPQIAAAGNCHFKVYKEDNHDFTISHIRKLTYTERVKEIAGMMSGEKISAAALETAQNLLK